MSFPLVLGVDVGGTKMAVSLWARPSAGDPTRLGRTEWATDPGGPAPTFDRIEREVAALLARNDATTRDLTAIGVSGGGPLDPEAGVIIDAPNLPGWRDVPIVRELERRFGAPAALENDANACARAEWLYGAGRGANHLAFLTCSTGIGAGLILDGAVYGGARSLAGEIGHVTIVPGGELCACERLGCLEAYASGGGMARRLEKLRRADASLPATAKEVVDRARAGDTFSQDFLTETAGYLADGLAALVFCLNLERIVLGTIPTAAGDLFITPLRSALSERVWPELAEGLEVVPSELWPDLGDWAAFAAGSRVQ